MIYFQATGTQATATDCELMPMVQIDVYCLPKPDLGPQPFRWISIWGYTGGLPTPLEIQPSKMNMVEARI